MICLTSDIVEDSLGYWNGRILVTSHVSEDMLAEFYIRFKKEGILKKIFYESETDITLRKFLDIHTPGKTLSLVCMVEDHDKRLNLAGLGWMGTYTKVSDTFAKAEMGIAFLTEHQTPTVSVPAGKLMVKMAFDKTCVDVLFGTTPEPNRAAVIYAKRLGFSLHGPIPNYTLWEGKPCGVWISSISRSKD